MSVARAGPGRTRAVLELLRAPLLLSPIADVAAGIAVACAGEQAWAAAGEASLAWPFGAADTRRAALVALIGCCLLAAGMVLNGIVDLPDDRLRKPERPLPSGAVSLRFASWLYGLLTAIAIGAALAASSDSRAVLVVCLLIVLVTGLYHLGGKRWRVPGCLLLGCARGLDLTLGAVALFGRPSTGALIAAAAYALYMTGASLHASTDDEPASGPWSRFGLSLCLAMLLATLLPLLGGRLRAGDTSAWLGAAVALLAVARLARAWATRPPPAITGAALSGLYLMLAALALSLSPPATRLPAAALVLLLFGLSRLIFRAFPPT